MKKKRLGGLKISVDSCLTVLAILALFGVVAWVIFLNFSYYWDNIHSDIAVDLLFVREAARQRRLFPYGWSHLFEMRFMHITTVMLPFYFITGDANLSYPLAVTTLLFVNMYLFYYMLSYRKRSWLPIIMGFLFMLIVFAYFRFPVDITFSIWSMFFVNGSLALSLSTVLITIGAYMRILTKKEQGRYKSKALWIVSPLLAFAQGIQSNRMLMAIYVPLLLFVWYPVLLGIVQEKGFDIKKVDKSVIFATVCFVANLAGVALIFFLIRQEFVLVLLGATTSDLSIMVSGRVWENIGRFFIALLDSVGLGGNVSVFSLSGVLYLGRLVTVIMLPLLVYKTTAKDNDDGIILCILFTSVCVLSGVMILTSPGAGVWPRYFFTILVWFTVLAVVVLDYSVQNKRKVLACVVCAFVFLMVPLSISELGMERRYGWSEDRQMVADFIYENNFTVGYAPFWRGPVIAAFGDFEFDVIPIIIGNFSHQPLLPEPRGVTLERFNHNENRTFLILTNAEAHYAMHHDHNRAILESGTRHDFPRGWVVFTFEHNPFR